MISKLNQSFSNSVSYHPLQNPQITLSNGVLIILNTRLMSNWKVTLSINFWNTLLLPSFFIRSVIFIKFNPPPFSLQQLFVFHIKITNIIRKKEVSTFFKDPRNSRLVIADTPTLHPQVEKRLKTNGRRRSQGVNFAAIEKCRIFFITIIHSKKDRWVLWTPIFNLKFWKDAIMNQHALLILKNMSLLKQ